MDNFAKVTIEIIGAPVGNVFLTVENSSGSKSCELPAWEAQPLIEHAVGHHDSLSGGPTVIG